MAQSSSIQGNSDHGSMQPQQMSGGRAQHQPQQMKGGLMNSAKERPIATAAAVGGAVAAGAFLWSRRNQVTDQLSQMSGQISDWSEKMRNQQGSSSSDMSGRSSTPMGVETTGQPELAGAGTSSTDNSPRATGGNRGKAQSGQTLSPSRAPSVSPSM